MELGRDIVSHRPIEQLRISSPATMKDENQLEMLMDLMSMNSFTGSDCDP